MDGEVFFPLVIAPQLQLCLKISGARVFAFHGPSKMSPITERLAFIANVFISSRKDTKKGKIAYYHYFIVKEKDKPDITKMGST